MEEAVESARGKGPIAALYIETPANPTRDRPYPVPEVPDDGESGAKQQALEERYFSSGDRRR
jgi:hypothetical protein